MNLYFSFIIPVYNRPDEVEELLESFSDMDGDKDFEIVIVEDGSSETCKSVIDTYDDRLNISYYFKPNSGPGDSRNYGMQRAKGNYFIILDSDVLLPKPYLNTVKASLQSQFYHCFGGPDAAHHSFTNLQKAINYTMTSFLTTGGIRGGKTQLDNFQPRSFNMGLSKEGFLATNGFGKIHPGEDPDLSLRLHKLNYKTTLISDAYVYHKRRISWSKFYKQVNKFGLTRPILNKWHPTSSRITFWFPFLFISGLLVSLLLVALKFYIPIILYVTYFVAIFIDASIKNKSIVIGAQSIVAVMVQFFGYGWGFIQSTITVGFLGRDPQKQYPKLFF